MTTQSAAHSRRRDKPILSCSFCRGRKLRCNRQSPCGACTRRSKPAECVYSSTEQERREAIDYRPHARNTQARQRIARLENLVTEMRDMMQQQSQTSVQPPQPLPPSAAGAKAVGGRSHPFSTTGPQPAVDRQRSAQPSSTVDPSSVDDMGKLSMNENRDHAIYTGSSHWSTILEDIQHLKDDLSESDANSSPTQETTPLQDDLMQGSANTRFSLLNSAPCLPREQILSMVPQRKVVDRLTSHFFNTFPMSNYMLHRERFLAEYASFWSNPDGVPITWLGLLFAVMALSSFLQQQDIGTLGLSAVENQDMLESYRTLTIQCLLAGDYLRPSRYTIETLILHFGVDQNINVDASIGNWALIGVVVRIAQRVGLHRDPSHWRDIRPLQAEVRRRLWLMLYQMDFFTSTQVGLPRIIKDSQCDTRPPVHVLAHDITPSHTEMPPERSPHEATALQHMIQRQHIIRVAAEIYDETEAGPPAPAITAALTAKLERAKDTIPEWLRYSAQETLVTENPITTLNALFLDILVHKATYLLHRRSFVRGVNSEEAARSNDSCITSALAILDHQRRVDEETQPGGLMSSLRWKLASSLNHEFLQATMMLCFALSRFDETHVAAVDPSVMQRRSDIVEALFMARSLWQKNTDRSLEARRAAAAITTVLESDLRKSPPSQSFPIVSNVQVNSVISQIPTMSVLEPFDAFDFGQNMALDPSFFAMDNDASAYERIFGDFTADRM